jgi:hypothetical protein
MFVAQVTHSMLVIGNEQRGIVKAVKGPDSVGVDIPNRSAVINYVNTQMVVCYENREILTTTAMKREIWAIFSGGESVYLCVVDNKAIADAVVRVIWGVASDNLTMGRAIVHIQDIIDKVIKELKERDDGASKEQIGGNREQNEETEMD